MTRILTIDIALVLYGVRPATNGSPPISASPFMTCFRCWIIDT